MALRIEDYALIGDMETAALVGIDGSIDWLCLPRFDSAACLAALLGTPENGRWLLHATGGVRRVWRRYRPGTLVLETTFETETGVVRIVDCMPPRRQVGESVHDIVRIVEGVTGTVAMEMCLTVRFDYGASVPWVRRKGDTLTAVAGPDGLSLRTPVEVHGEGLSTVARFSVSAGESVPFRLTWYPSHLAPPAPVDDAAEVAFTEGWWRDWSGRSRFRGEYGDVVLRSLITLKALTYAPTGGVVAAATTSLPEWLGGVRNWDYRYCWLRDAAFTLSALMSAGYVEEARAWRAWLLRAVAGSPGQIQVLYGVAGERRLPEMELPWLAGYEGSTPVRVGNGASTQFQLDVYGEIMEAAYQARRAGLEDDEDGASGPLMRAILDFVEAHWTDPDEGIWEVRGPRRHFTHSKVMAWVAFDRAIRLVEEFGGEAPVERWRQTRAAIHDDVCRNGFDASLKSFVQSYGSNQLDASLLLLPIVGFLPPDDPRIRGTIEAIKSHLCNGPFVARYSTEEGVDGLPPGEGAFLICSFWLVDALAVSGLVEEARTNFEQLVSVANDVGLLAEEYEPGSRRLLGNFPQAFSHIGLINSAERLAFASTRATTST